ncbi:carbohydrate-binding module family 1 protein [Aplosporella prunicola CBS 121167]|uniref:Carbohydrate-binding module family 1 protein n=1 Tax=Aplosporella prunicola CBS 121167 TaxID=1176127 RepID=A0A6A6B9Z9_9PEZI|nr:carbohydrate-binding module family 1 protein [Aplosporella prunicola CBS 121167]KAF2140135.1 carbohydrate-binding module family 1 protein [Aplosporella prunicola CBS 121167]
MRYFASLVAAAALAPTLVVGQLSGSVGPLSSASDKAATKTCDVTKYGAKADKTTDIGPALASAHADCSEAGGVIVVPEGDYAIETWVKLSGGKGWALQIDGTIYRTGTDGGNMIFIEHTSDVEVFSSTGAGAFQGNGYEFHKDGNIKGPRILRLYEVTDFSVHDLALVDSPAFHFSMDTCENGEVYNMAIRGAEMGGLDGIDVWSNNIWVHDVMVTNKDECVTVKSPSKNILVENIYCNWSGGCAFGSLAEDTDISDVVYRNIYTYKSNQMMMIKSYGGSGSVSNVLFENFIGRSNSYSLDIDQYWSSMSEAEGEGVQLNNITFKGWRGTEADGHSRGPVKVLCADGAPCTDITITDFQMWTESGDEQTYSCQSAYGSGFCLKEASGSDAAAYSATTSVAKSAPTGYKADTMPDDLDESFGSTASIPIPEMPASFFPGVAPISALAAGGGASAATPTPVAAVAAVVKVSASSEPAAWTPSVAAPTAAATTAAATAAAESLDKGSVDSALGQLKRYEQCGGSGWKGAGKCASGTKCQEQNSWYHQCI